MKAVSGIRWVDTSEGVDEVAAACRVAGRFSLDTEADSFHSYFHRVCLVQVSADGCHFVIDPLSLETSELDSLWRVAADPDVEVLMHGADYDVRILDRDYEARISGLVDTQIMAQLLGEPQTGLAALLDKEFGLKLDKRFQRANWKARPLSQSQLEYAATDTAFLGELVNRLYERLQELGRVDWAREEFDRLEQVRYVRPPQNGLAFERMKGARKLKGRARDRVFTLYEWREEVARNRDVPPFKIIGNAPLLELAAKPPADRRALSRIAGVGPRISGRWGRKIMAVLANPRNAPEPSPAVVKPALDSSRKAMLKRLVESVDRISEELGLNRGLLCPRATLQSLVISDPFPANDEELRELGLVGWRLEILGPDLLETLKDS